MQIKYHAAKLHSLLNFSLNASMLCFANYAKESLEFTRAGIWDTNPLSSVSANYSCYFINDF